MTAERFLALVEAWGADARRWPADERAAAEAFAAARPDLAGPILAGAEALDALLGASPVTTPSASLRDRVIASAAEAGLRARGQGRLWWNRLGLALGAGWAAAACAGVVAGVVLTGQLTAAAEADAVLYQASLLAFDDTEVLG